MCYCGEDDFFVKQNILCKLIGEYYAMYKYRVYGTQLCAMFSSFSRRQVWKEIIHYHSDMEIRYHKLWHIPVSQRYIIPGPFMNTPSNGTISALLALCEGNSPVTGEYPSQRPVTRIFDVVWSEPEQTAEWTKDTGDLRRIEQIMTSL